MPKMLAAIAALFVCATATAQGTLTFAPAHTAKAPLVFAFPGHDWSLIVAADKMRIHELWPEAVVVYMKPDLAHFDEVLAATRQKYSIDDDRIYATGYSDGATFVYTLWAKRGHTFAAFAVVSGELAKDDVLTERRALLHIYGEDDKDVPDQLRTIKAARKIDGAMAEGTACGFGCTLYESKSGTPVNEVIHRAGDVYPSIAPRLTVEFLRKYRR